MSKKREVQIDYKTIKLFRMIVKFMSPPPILKVSDWADNYRILSAGASAEPGKWNTSRAEYQREIMDAVNDNECVEIIIMSSAQVGKTEIILNIIGYYIDYDPSPILVIQPTDSMAETFSKDRLSKMIRDTPALSDKISSAKSRDSENTILHKTFPGGHITMIGANAPSGLASRPIKILLCDEVDRYPKSAGTEGDPVDLAEKRTTTFWNKKIVKVSTPTIKNASRIEIDYNESSKEKWNVACPCCGQYQPFEWGRLRFSDVKMKCKYCEEYFSEVEWKQQPGKWIAENDNRKVRGFHLNEMASPWKSWNDIIKDYQKAWKTYKKTRNPESLKVWINTSLGETWEEKGEAADEDTLISRRETYTADLPEGVLIITAGIDVQDDRFELEITGWGKEYESWGIRTDKIYGDLENSEEPWRALEEYLNKEFHFENGNGLIIAASCIDTGGHHTTKTYKWLKKMLAKGKRVYGIKGMGGQGIPFVYKISTNNSEKVKIFLLGVDSGKETLLSRLKLKEVGPGYCHFPVESEKGYDEDYMKGLTSEQRIIRTNKKGKPEIVWVKKSGVRNEPLDMRNYATAAVEILKPNWRLLEKKVKEGINYMKVTAKKKPAQERKTGIVNRGYEI
ncbi:phage terminase large subunit family protein [Anaerocolumna sp. MB42-C2]|uniref:phage terminase large subunit family protein n=1 Tax=Anaerocolumna sp. MB42-C2 TaxID=3070997 RepID=UPI0027DF31C7|nr:phage terminase large subunit family protein [Anaerocolumna sp. MB42-C2]WMJ88875.1 phage terminase large subunit family protein [Anaerocolumna sp. MB42-C2]